MIRFFRFLTLLFCGFLYAQEEVVQSVYFETSKYHLDEKQGNAVEFINNCVAVIDDDKEFISLWLKPQSLPNL